MSLSIPYIRSGHESGFRIEWDFVYNTIAASRARGRAGRRGDAHARARTAGCAAGRAERQRQEFFVVRAVGRYYVGRYYAAV